MMISLDSVFAFDYYEGYTFTDFKPQTHELIYFISGKGVTKINGCDYDYQEDTVCFTRKGDIRDSTCQKKTAYICIRFLGEPSEEMGLESGVYESNHGGLFELFAKIQKEVLAKDYNYYRMTNLLIEEILCLLARKQKISPSDEGFYRLIKEIDGTMDYRKSVEEMAVSVGYSYDHFRHKFKVLTGQSPTQFVINKRIENACKLLQDSQHTCTEISLMCGFSDGAQFSRLFKRVMGISPKAYRKH